MISINDEDEDAKIEYMIEEVNDWLNRVKTSKKKKILKELLKSWIEVIHDIRIYNKLLKKR